MRTNPLLRFNWNKVRFLSVDGEALQVSVIIEGKEPKTVQFETRQEMDKHFAEWIEITDLIYTKLPDEADLTNK